MEKKLTAKQLAWIDYYKQGKNATEAARLAGYRGKNHDVIGAQNLGKLREHIIDRDKVLEKPRIADMAEINEFWTSIIRDREESTTNRLKASELRAKVQGAFIDNVNIKGEINNPAANLTEEQLRKLASEDDTT